MLICLNGFVNMETNTKLALIKYYGNIWKNIIKQVNLFLTSITFSNVGVRTRKVVGFAFHVIVLQIDIKT